jgi:hypothetical protein
MSVKTVQYLPEDQLIQKALEALLISLGPAEATRFLTLTRGDRLESVMRHRQWQNNLDRDEFFDLVFTEK